MAKLSKEQARQPASRSHVIKKWILSHKIESTAILVCLLGAVVILCLVFAGGDNEAPPTNTQTPTNGGGETSSGDISGTDTTGGDDNEVPPQSAQDTLEASAIYKKLALVSDLQDPTSPQYKAADWLVALDFLKLGASSPTLEQRFALASFYFSTGGGLTSKQGWTRCSAVPPPALKDDTEAPASNMQCVLRDGKIICAERENFEVCAFTDEYGSASEGKRFLSPVEECEWFGVTCDENGVVTMIDIESNELSGELPAELSLLSGLTRLNLSNNTVGGNIPKELGLLNGMIELLLTSNELEGDIPVEIYDLPLERLEFERNKLQGSLSSEIGNFGQLQVLYINHNNLEGELPSEIGKLATLRKATFNANNFSGPIPSELGLLSNLESVKFSNNKLEGGVPCAAGLGRLGIPISADCLEDSNGNVLVTCPCCSRCCNADGRCENY